MNEASLCSACDFSEPLPFKTLVSLLKLIYLPQEVFIGEDDASG